MILVVFKLLKLFFNLIDFDDIFKIIYIIVGIYNIKNNVF